jgi:hypothetical protein
MSELPQAIIHRGLSVGDYLYRLFTVTDRLGAFAKAHLLDEGWTDKFPELLNLYLKTQLHLAHETPPGEPMPNVRLEKLGEAD